MIPWYAIPITFLVGVCAGFLAGVWGRSKAEYELGLWEGGRRARETPPAAPLAPYPPSWEAFFRHVPDGQGHCAFCHRCVDGIHVKLSDECARRVILYYQAVGKSYSPTVCGQCQEDITGTDHRWRCKGEPTK